ncbi:MFS transporter [Crenobacter caeni]|uniref:MFS transporter n=1 Tax=Crenobacter caeni TaxID=2705474 RepID=A0A6B2KNN8_9NEIS|nr:MFS transporter [Crenobacter caeni]NDV11790.1 MFS transporter [Crenobacter caeni]
MNTPAPQDSSPHQGLLDLIDQATLDRSHARLWALASGGTLLNGMSLMLLGIALPLLTVKFALSPTEQGLLGAALVFGSVPGALLGGFAADRAGRKPVFIVDMVLVALGAALAAWAQTPLVLAAGLLLVGFGIGVDFPVSGTYVAEWMPVASRPRAMVALKGSQAAGMVIGAGAGLALLDASPASEVWRLLLGCTGLCAVLIALARLTLQESPRWLMLHGRNLEAAHALASILPHLAGHSLRHAQAAGTARHVQTLANPAHAMHVRSLLQTPYRRRTALSCLPWLLMDIATYGVGLFTPVILASLGLNDAGASLIGRDAAATRGSTLVDLALLAGAVASLYFVPWLGAIRAQAIGFAGMVCGMLLMLLAISGLASPHSLVWTLSGFALYNLAMYAGPNATTFALPPVLFPTQLRATACGIASSMAKVGACIGILFLPMVREQWGIAAVLELAAIISLSGCILTLWLSGRNIPVRPLEYHQTTASLPEIPSIR